MKGCEGCNCNCKKSSWFGFWKRLYVVLMAAVVVGLGMNMITGDLVEAHDENETSEEVAKSCYTTSDVAHGEEDGMCLVVFDGKVYDVTDGEKWGIEGHLGGKHPCGKIYTQETIEAGPHLVDVMEPFLVAPICGEPTPTPEVVTKVTDAPKAPPESEGVIRKMNYFSLSRPLGMSWRTLTSYLSLVFFLLNFLTCYAMPWAKWRAPWAGERPGGDDQDMIGHFPLIHWHPWFAWGAIFFFTLHGVLGFLCVWGFSCL